METHPDALPGTVGQGLLLLRDLRVQRCESDMTKSTQPESSRGRNKIQNVSDSTTSVLHHHTKTLPILVFHICPPLPSTTCQIPSRMPKSLWLVIAGSSPCQVNVSNQSSSPGRENQPIRAVSRCLTTRRQPERLSAVFPPGGWALANMLREAPLCHGCWEEGVSRGQMI